MRMRRLALTSLATAGLLAAAAPVQAVELTIASWGGVVTDANRAAYWAPFTKATGIGVRDEVFNGELAKVRAQEEANAIQWDIAEMEDGETNIGCAEGTFEALDLSGIPQADLIPGTVTRCGIASLTAAVVLTYNAAKLSTGPATWADFFDLQKFPGKRGLRKTPTTTLEAALLADGVAPPDVYKVLATREGQDRAFRRLDTIKPNIVWYTSGTEQIQGFVSGEYDIGTTYNARVATVDRQEHQKLQLVWDAGYLVGHNFWVVLKGAPNPVAAHQFLQFATQPGPQAEYMRHIDYGSANTLAYQQLSPDRLAFMPGAQGRAGHQVAFDAQVWGDNLDALTERFNRWLSN